MKRRISSICTIAGNRIDGGVGQPTMPLATQTATAMQAPVLALNKTLVIAAANEVLKPTLTATEAVKEVARRLQVFGKALPGTPVYMNHCRRQAIALINSAELKPRYKYFLTYGANDLYWPEIPEMVGRLKARQQKATCLESIVPGASACLVPMLIDDESDNEELGKEEDGEGEEEQDDDEGQPRPRLLVSNPCDISRMKISELKSALQQRGEVDFSSEDSKLDLYFRLCNVHGFCLTAQTAALSVADLRLLLRKYNLRDTGTKSELQKRLTLQMRPPLSINMLSQSDRQKMVSMNPLISTLHYFDREKALWKHTLNGKHRPLGNIGSFNKRHDNLQRGSWHTHSLLGCDPNPDEVLAEDATIEDICDEFARVASAEHGSRFPNFDDFGKKIDAEQEAYLFELENKRVPTTVPAVGVPNILTYDAQGRPKIPFRLHPGHERTNLLKGNQPGYKARSRANRSAYQFHRCMKTCYKYGGTICRFRYPRRLRTGKAMMCFRGAGADGAAKKRVYIELPRDQPWMNPTMQVIQNTWGSNIDIQRIVDEPGSCSYMLSAAYYQMATTKPENDALTKRMKASLARLGSTSTVAQRMTKVANVMMNTLQIPLQAQLVALLGHKDFPIVESSHTCIDVLVVPRVMQSQIIDVDALTTDIGSECTTLSSKRKLVECYMQRNKCESKPCPLICYGSTVNRSWSSLCFREFASNFFLTTSKNDKIFFQMGDYRVAQHIQPVGIAPIPHISSDESDEQSAYGTLFLWHPFKEERELYIIPAHGSTPEVKTTAVEVLAYLKQSGLLTGMAKRSRQVEVMAEAARAGFGANEDGSNFDGNDGGCPDGPQEDGGGAYDGLADEGISAAMPTCALVPSTGAAVGGASISVLAPAKYLELRHFVATKEKEAKQARSEALHIFDRGANDGHGQGGADFGNACNSESPLNTKEMELEEQVAKLSKEQRDCYNCVVHYLEPGSKAGQLLKILSGAAGVGKSTLLEAIVLYLRLQFGSKAAEVVAQTNAAAKLVDGHTIDSTFPEVMTKKAKDEKGLKKKQAAIDAFRERFSSVKLLIHEEHSLTNSETFYRIHCCFCAAFPEKAHLPFAGFHVSNLKKKV